MARKQTTRRQKKPAARKNFQWRPRVSIKAVLYVLSLFLLLVFTVGMLTYVIFFRMVVAAELVQESDVPVFEEPVSPGIIIGREDVRDVALQPRCAIIIDDLGHDHDIGRRFIELPFELSFSFLPHATYTKDLEKQAYMLGRSILLHLPLEPRDRSWDPGPGALYLDELSRQRQTFLENLSTVPHAVGVNNHMGSSYSENQSAMESLLRLIGEKKLFFIDSYTSSKSLGYSLAVELGVPAARRHVFLDNELEVEAICNQLEKLMEIAQKQGQAIGIAHPHPQTLAAFSSCLPAVESAVSLVAVDQLLD